MTDKLDDKTRVLMNIIESLLFTMSLGRKDSNGLWVDYRNEVDAQFADNHLVKPKPGDIVMCSTGRINQWKIAYFVKDCRDGWGGYHLLREIGSDRLCRMSNERLETLIGVPSSLLLDGLRQKIHRWATVEAFSEKYNPKSDYFVRCGGAEFIGDDVIRIWVRPHIVAQEKRAEDGKTLHAQPWSVDVSFSKKTRLKDIVSALIAAGYPREWEYTEDEPTNGMAGCAKITKESLTGTLKNAGLNLKEQRP